MNEQTPQDENVFIQHAERYEMARTAHLKKFLLSYPRPKEPKMKELITWNHWVIGLILIASAIISASHTLPVVLKGNDGLSPVVGFILAVATFIMIEITAIYFAYAHIISVSRNWETPDITKPLRVGVLSTVGAMFVINIYGVLDTSGKLPDDPQFTLAWSLVAVFIYLWIASIPPINAYLCGDILAIQVMGLKHENSIGWDDYQKELEDWRNSLERSWNSKKKEYGDSIKVSVPSSPTLPHGMETGGNSQNFPNSIPIGNGNMESSYGFQRNSSALDKALEHYRNNPDDIELNPIELSNSLGIGKSTMYKARKIFQENGDIGE